MESLFEQFLDLLLAMSIGVVLGATYDIHSWIRCRYRLKRLASTIGDLIYWLLMTVAVFALLLAGNRGEVRFYLLVGIALGALFYTHQLSNKAKKVVSFLGRPVLFIGKTAVCPFRFIARLFFKKK